MFKRFVSCCCFFFALTLSLFGASQGTVQGIVTNAITGTVLSGVTITIFKNNQVHATTTTNGSGFYTITTTPDKKYVIVASLTDYQTQSQGLIIEKDQTTIADFALQPNPGTLIVTTEDGSYAPISFANVNVYQNNILIATGTTDGEGKVTFPTLAPGSYTVVAFKANYATTPGQAIIASNQTTNLTLIMASQVGTLSGNVKGDGVNLENVLIELLLNNVLITSTLTNSLGNYSISGINPNTYVVHAHIAGFSTGTQAVAITANTTTTANFALSSVHGSVEGNVTSSQGVNLAGVTIEVLQNDILIASTLTDYQGYYFINSLDPGTYIMHAHDPGYQNGLSGLIIIADQTSTVNFVLSPETCSLSGTVKNNLNNPLPLATVEVNLDNIILFSTFTDPQGNYLIQGINPGDYVLHAHDSGYKSGIVPKTLVSGANTQNFVLDPAASGSLTGTVKDTLNNTISGAIVELNLDNVTVFYTASGSDGTYNFSDIPSNTYVLHCHKPLFQTGIGSIQINNTPTTYDFILKGSASRIQGYVNAHSSGAPIQGAVIVLYYNGLYINTAVSGPDGFYDQPGLPPGNYQMFISYQGFLPTSANLSLGDSQVLQQNFVLYSTAAVTGGSATLALNRYALQTQRVYQIAWQPSSDPAVKSYDIFRNTQKIAHLPINSASSYQDKTPPNSVVIFYKIVSLNAQNQPIGELNVYPQ